MEEIFQVCCTVLLYLAYEVHRGDRSNYVARMGRGGGQKNVMEEEEDLVKYQNI